MPVLWTAKRVAPMTATEHSGLGPTRTEIRDTVIRMRADLAHRWTLAELAQDAHLSPSRLGGLFVEQFGVPPIMLLARLRVREMARLLRESDMTVGEIGVRVGWGGGIVVMRRSSSPRSWASPQPHTATSITSGPGRRQTI